MEHISVSESATLSAPIIPYIGSKAWDGSPFLEYMEREKWTEAQLIGSDESCRRNETEILDFLQTWLYFGLLCEVNREEGQRAYFVRALPDGRHVICTKYLRAVHQRNLKQREPEPDSEFEVWQKHLTQCLNAAHSILARLAIEKVPYMASPVMLGIASLCDFVKHTVLVDEMRARCSMLVPEATRFIQNQMTDQGWCPADVRRWSTGLDVASFFLISSQSRPDEDRTHTDCSEDHCQAYQIEPNLYVRVHEPRCERTDCVDLVVNPTELYDTLSSGVIPLAKYCEDSTGRPALCVVKATPGTKYVAISHVWSDGLGNPLANSLYSCQARRIARYVKSISENGDQNVPFWLDTLSCPVSPEEATDLAISMMRETYTNAEKVLVVNSHLVDREQPGLGMEILCLILSSSWSRRLWTLQEGVLAKEIHFQFKDQSISLNTAMGFMQLEIQQFLQPNSVEYAALLNAAAMLHDLWVEYGNVLSKERLQFLHHALQWRSTSVPTDEPLCVSALLGIPIRDVATANVEHRTKQLWKLIETPPRAVIFWSGDRLKEPGYRWAPANLLAQPNSIFSSVISSTYSVSRTEEHEEQTRITDDGLITTGDGLHLGDWTTAIPRGFFVSTRKDQLLHVTRTRGVREKKEVFNIEPPTCTDADRQAKKQISLLLYHPAEGMLSSSEQPDRTTALLVSHDKHPDTSIKAHVEDVCYVFSSYFLTTEQKRYVGEVVDDCVAALAASESSAVVAIEKRGIKQQFSNEPVGDETESLYVSRDSEGICRIEYDNAYWWVECGQVLRNQGWVLD